VECSYIQYLRTGEHAKWCNQSIKSFICFLKSQIIDLPYDPAKSYLSDVQFSQIFSQNAVFLAIFLSVFCMAKIIDFDEF